MGKKPNQNANTDMFKNSMFDDFLYHVKQFVKSFKKIAPQSKKAKLPIDEEALRNRRMKTVNVLKTLASITIFSSIFAGTSFIATAAEAPEQYVINAKQEKMPAYETAGQVFLPDIMNEVVKVLYVPPKPQVNPDTYGPETNDFKNNPDGVVQWPFLRGVPITSPFGLREAVCAEGCEFTANHTGTDFAPNPGAEVQAIADGVVIHVTNFPDNVMETGDYKNSAGTYIIIKHNIDGQDVTSLYAHLQYDSIPLKPGDAVNRGQLVGKVGNTGMSTAAHLHLEIKINGTVTDPVPFLTKYNAINVKK